MKFILICLSERREEVHGEAQRVLRCLPGKNRKENASKQMPSFPEMVYYIQEKVWHLTLDDSLSYVMDMKISIHILGDTFKMLLLTVE